MKFIHKTYLIVSLCCLARVLVAQDTTEINLNETVISATRTQQSRSAVAQVVQVISQKNIEQINAQTTADLLQNTGGVFVQRSQQGGGSPVLRGFEASRVLIIVDGIRMNNAIYRSGHLQNVITVDNNSLERAEVLFGPASTVYGSDALGGAMVFFTKKPMFSTAAKQFVVKAGGMARYGTVNNEKTVNVFANLGGHRLAAFSSFSYSDFGDLRMGEKEGSAPFFGLRPQYAQTFAGKDSLVTNKDPYLQRNSGYHQYDILEKISFRQNSNTEHTLNVQFSNSSNIDRYDRLTDPGSNNTGLRFAAWYYGPQQRFLAAYQVRLKSAGWFNNGVFSSLSWQDIQESRISRRFGRTTQKHQVEDLNVLGLTVMGERVAGNNTTRLGVDVQHTNAKSTAFDRNIVDNTETPTNTRYPDGGNTMTDCSVFGTMTQSKGKLIFNEGVRAGYSVLESKFRDKTFFPFPYNEVQQKSPVISGNLGLIWLPTHRWKYFINASTGFRMPNIDDTGKVFDSQKGSLIVPNPDIKPEQTLNLELGVAYQIQQNLRWEASVWNTAFRNAIVNDRFQFNGQDSVLYDGVMSRVFANQNKRMANIYGVSSSLEWFVVRNLSVSATGTYTKGQILPEEGDKTPLDHIPPVFGRFGVRYDNTQWQAEIFSIFNGKKPIKDYFLNGEDNEQYAPAGGMPSWYTVNMRLGYRITPHLQIQAGIDNLLDTQYRVFASGINGPGRNFFLTVRVK